MNALVIAAIAVAALPRPVSVPGHASPAGHGASMALAPASRQSQSARPSAEAARAAFDRLKTLAGTHGVRSADGATGGVLFEGVSFEYRVTGAGSVLMELANDGTPEEMLSVFFMEGDRLILQHYCSVGNQPRLELVRADSAALLFDLAGGDNFDPESDGHIHRVRFVFADHGSVESWWTWFENGREHHTGRRTLHRRRNRR